MRTFISWLAVVAVSFMVGCAGMDSSSRADQKRALAPSGKLRVGMLLVPNHAVKDPATGELKGIAVDLGRAAAERMGVPFEAVTYTSFGAMLGGAKSGEWDMGTMGITPERQADVDFTRPYMVAEYAFLTAGPAMAARDLNKAGIRIGVLKQSSPAAYLAGSMKEATIVPYDTVAQMTDALSGQKVQALYGTRGGMLAQVSKVPGSRVLDESWGGEETAIAVPKGHPERTAFLARFVEDAKATGLVKSAIDKSGVRGLVVAK